LRVVLQGGGVYVDSRNSGTVTITSSSIYGNTANQVRAHVQKFPSPQCETHDLCVVLQGGGVYVYSGTVSIVDSQVYSNQASYVRAHAQKFPSPKGETHAC